jgi:hypothetical protein
MAKVYLVSSRMQPVAIRSQPASQLGFLIGFLLDACLMRLSLVHLLFTFGNDRPIVARLVGSLGRVAGVWFRKVRPYQQIFQSHRSLIVSGINAIRFLFPVSRSSWHVSRKPAIIPVTMAPLLLGSTQQFKD